MTLLLLLPVLALFATFARERQSRIDHALELSAAYRGTAMLLGDVIEADDEYTGSHSRDVVEFALAVADRLRLGPRERQQVEFAALLHDVGKVKIPAEIVDKPGPLDDDERAVMMTHTVLGEQMLEQVGGLLGEIGYVVRSCHERWDGAGYPDGIAGETIPLAARIVCCCDAWSAMTTDRPYRRALPEREAAAELRRCRGTHSIRTWSTRSPASSTRSIGPVPAAPPPCSPSAARAAILAAPSLRSLRPTVENGGGPDRLVCHDLTGDAVGEMAVTVFSGGTAGDTAWVVFRRDGGRWKLAYAQLHAYKAGPSGAVAT